VLFNFILAVFAIGVVIFGTDFFITQGNKSVRLEDNGKQASLAITHSEPSKSVTASPAETAPSPATNAFASQTATLEALTAALIAAAPRSAAPRSKPTDPQIAHIAYTSGQIDIVAANLALKKTHTKAVRSFAEEMIRDHEAVNKQALSLLDKLKVEPEDNGTSIAMTELASKKREELSKLSGAAFDKAYAENEVAYLQAANAALGATLIPATQNGELKSLLQTELKLFQNHERHAEHLVTALK
jgi:putative membrane protein